VRLRPQLQTWTAGLSGGSRRTGGKGKKAEATMEGPRYWPGRLSEQQVSGCDSNAGMAVLAHELKMRGEQRGVNHVTKDTG
jgi:hypothetical protein